MYLLFNHTHWGHRIQVARRSGKDGRAKDPMRFFASQLFRRISFFLRGLYDPIWSKPERTKYADYTSCRHATYRAQRLLEVLKTTDGLFLQRFLSYPEEVWTWEKYDLFVLQSLSILITDEFFDGLLKGEALEKITTHYEQLKRARKLFKLVIHQDEASRHWADLNGVPRWVHSFLGAAWKRSLRHAGYAKAYLAGTLSQTRGSGTPPPLVTLRAKRKFLTSVQEKPKPMSPTSRALVRRALEDAFGDLPKGLFTGLETKSRVTVSGAACWEATRKEGGTAQAILQIMLKYDDSGIPIRCLDTGKILDWRQKGDFESIGTAIFWACLNEVLMTNPEELREVHLTIVKEPGKARVVTKGRAALKIVLDTVSKICSFPLKKGFKSSESGMGRAHHGWNLFRDFTSEEMYDLLFRENRKEREQDEFHDHVSRLCVWEDVYLSSTDYQEATDRLVHELAHLVGKAWMRKCGIPPFLQGIVIGTCFQPRTVYFTATGPLSDVGAPAEGDTRTIRLYRGVLMGDPLTKVILHLVNIISRKAGQGLFLGSLFNGSRNSSEAHDTFLAQVRG
jgi:hypothetical protein